MLMKNFEYNDFNKMLTVIMVTTQALNENENSFKFSKKEFLLLFFKISLWNQNNNNFHGKI